MANMSYCRFSNTLGDLQDCYDNMGSGDLSEGEEQAKKKLISLCGDIHGDYGEDDE